MNSDKDNKREETPTQIKRRILSQLSRDAEDIKKRFIREAQESGNDNRVLYWASKTINFMLLNFIYDTGGAKEFKTFMQWKHEGATIKKGEKAFIIWGQPLGSREDEEAPAPEDSENLFFPLCYLFSENQVRKAEENAKEETESRQQPEPEQIPAETITDDIF